MGRLASRLLAVAHDAPADVVAELATAQLDFPFTNTTPALLTRSAKQVKSLPAQDAEVLVCYLDEDSLAEVFRADKRKGVRLAIAGTGRLPATMLDDVVDFLRERDAYLTNSSHRAAVDKLLARCDNDVLYERIDHKALTGSVIDELGRRCTSVEDLDLLMGRAPARTTEVVAVALASDHDEVRARAMALADGNLDEVLGQIRAVTPGLLATLAQWPALTDAVTEALQAPRWRRRLGVDPALAAHASGPHGELIVDLLVAGDRLEVLADDPALLAGALAGVDIDRLFGLANHIDPNVPALRAAVVARATAVLGEPAADDGSDTEARRQLIQLLSSRFVHSMDATELDALVDVVAADKNGCSTLTLQLGHERYDNNRIVTRARARLIDIVEDPITRAALLVNAAVDTATANTVVRQMLDAGGPASYSAADRLLSRVPLDGSTRADLIVACGTHLRSLRVWGNRDGANVVDGACAARIVERVPDPRQLPPGIFSMPEARQALVERVMVHTEYLDFLLGAVTLSDIEVRALLRHQPSLADVLLSNHGNAANRSREAVVRRRREVLAMTTPNPAAVLRSFLDAPPEPDEMHWLSRQAFGQLGDSALTTLSELLDKVTVDREVLLDAVRTTPRLLPTWAAGRFGANPAEHDSVVGVIAELLEDTDCALGAESAPLVVRHLDELPTAREWLTATDALLRAVRESHWGTSDVLEAMTRLVYELLVEQAGTDPLVWRHIVTHIDTWPGTLRSLAQVSIVATSGD